MERSSLFLMAGGILASAFVVSPALETRHQRSLAPVPVASRIPSLAPAAPPPSIPAIDPADVRSKSRSSQTMGTGTVDVALDAGEDPFAGIGEDEDLADPVDELAGMTVAERAAAQRAALDAAGEDEPEGADEPDDPRDEPAQEAPAQEDLFAGIGEEGDYGEPVDEIATMTPEERAAAARRALDEAGEDDTHDEEEEADSSAAGAANQITQQPSALRTPPPKDPRAAAYDARIDSRFDEVEAVRQRSNPPGAPIDPSGVAPVVSGEGRRLQELNLDAGLDAPLRDSRGTEVTRSTVLGLLLIRDMYIAMANAMANVFDAIREGDLAYKRERTQALYEPSLELARLQAARDSAKVKYDGAIRAAGSIRGHVTEDGIRRMTDNINQLKRDSEAATAAYDAAMDGYERQFPEINVLVDGVPLWQALAQSRGEGVQGGLDRVAIYNRHLEQGAADLRARAAAAQAHDTLDELMEYGRPEYARVRDGVRMDGRSVGSGRADLLMNQVESVRAAYDIHVAVDSGWTKVLLATTGVGIIAAGWVILPLSAVAYGALGVSVIDVVLEGSELVVRYEDARAMEESAPIVGWRYVLTAQDRERASVGSTVLAAVAVGVDTAVIRSIRVVGPVQSGATEIPSAARVGEVADAARAAGAAEYRGLRTDDIAHWRGIEAAEIQRMREYGHTLADATDAKLAQLDEVVLAAERAGVPRSVIDDGLDRIRDTKVSMVNELERISGSFTPFDLAIKDFRIRMVIAEAIQKDFTIISRIEDTAYLSKLGGSQAKILILEPSELNRLIGKVVTDRGAGAVTFTSQEADLARQIVNQDATKLYVFDPQQAEGGLYRLLDADDLAALQRYFGPDAPRPPTIVDSPSSGPPPDLPPRQIDTEADTNLDVMGRPADHETQVLRQEDIDELPPDAPTVRLPARVLEEADRTPTQVLRLDEIGEYPLDAPTVRFPAREMEGADRTPTRVLRPGEVEDAALEAETVRLGRGDLTRQIGAASCPPPGPCGPNQIIAHADDPAGFIRRHYGPETRAADAYEIVVRELGPQNVDGIAGGYAGGRARIWSWPEGTSYLDAKRMDKFGGELYDPGIVARMPPDVQRAYAGARELGAERLPSDLDIPVDDAIDAGRLEDLGKKVFDETGVLVEFTSSRIRGGGPGNAAERAPAPPGPPPSGAPSQGAAQPGRLSELDQRVIQKAFRTGRGENLEWTAEELTRLQQIAYPPSGSRPSAVQERLMPVAEQLGGQMKTQRQDARTFGQALDQANEAYLAHQELEDMIGIARLVGVPEERILLHVEGLAEGMPSSVLERSSRGLLREIDAARGIRHESGVPDDYFIVTRMYVAAKARGNRLTESDIAWLRERMDADQNFLRDLSRREFDDAAGESHTIMDPPAAQDLEEMYRAGPGGGAPVSQGTPVSQGPPATINLASGEAASIIGGPSGRGGTSAPVEVVILSTAGSTGPVMEAFFLNKGKPVQIQGEGIVLEPVANVDAATMRRIDEIREAAIQGKPVPSNDAEGPGGGALLGDSWSGASVVRVVLDAYCLQADLDVPTQGMLFRIADASKQAEFGDLAAIIDASQQLHDRGALDPSGDPEDYFHSIRQWAVWSEEKDMDDEAFEDAFVEHARRNITAAGQPWNADVEEVVREYAPGRWRDVEAVLKLAGVR